MTTQELEDINCKMDIIVQKNILQVPELNHYMNDIYNSILYSIVNVHDTKIFLPEDNKAILFGYMDSYCFEGIIKLQCVNLEELEHNIINENYIYVKYCESSCNELDKICNNQKTNDVLYSQIKGLKFSIIYGNYQQWFDETARWLLQSTELLINAHQYYIAEIEFYVYNNVHQDTYTHQSKEQKNTFGEWYFHREKSAKIGFTLKGMDITLGLSNTAGGILIRSIKSIDGNIIEGPSKTVDEILRKNKVESVIELKSLSTYDSIVTNSNNICLCLIETKCRNQQLFRGMRIGLNSAKNILYFDKPYRYAINGIKKNKKTLLPM